MDRPRGGSRSRGSNASHSPHPSHTAHTSHPTHPAHPAASHSRPSHSPLASQRRSQSSASPAAATADRVVHYTTTTTTHNPPAAVPASASLASASADPLPPATSAAPFPSASSSSSQQPSNLPQQQTASPQPTRGRPRNSLRHVSPSSSSPAVVAAVNNTHPSSSDSFNPFQSNTSAFRPQSSGKASKTSLNPISTIPAAAAVFSNPFTQSPPVSPTIMSSHRSGSTRRRSRANDADPASTAATQSTSAAEEDAVSKGGHTLRKRTRVDYNSMEHGDTIVDFPPSKPGGDQASSSPLVTGTSTRGRKRKSVHTDGQHGDETSSPPPPTATKKIRLVNHAAATSAAPVTAAAGQSRSEATATPAPPPAPRPRGRPPRKPPVAANTQQPPPPPPPRPTAPSSSSHASTQPSPSNNTIVVQDTIEVVGSPVSASDTEHDSSESATPSDRANSQSSGPPQSNKAKFLPVASTNVNGISPAAKVAKSGALTSAPNAADTPTPTPRRRPGRPRRTSLVSGAAVKAESKPPSTTVTDSSPETAKTTSSTVAEESPSKTRKRLMLRIPRGPNHSPPSVFAINSESDEERYATLMASRTGDAHAKAKASAAETAALSILTPMDAMPQLALDKSSVNGDKMDTLEDTSVLAAKEDGELPQQASDLPKSEQQESGLDPSGVSPIQSVNGSTAVATAVDGQDTKTPVEESQESVEGATAINGTRAPKTPPSVTAASEDNEADDASPTAHRPATRRTSTRIASAVAQKEMAVLEAHEAKLKDDKERKVAKASATTPPSAKKEKQYTARSWEHLTPFTSEVVYYPEQFDAPPAIASTPNTEVVEQNEPGAATATAADDDAAQGRDTPTLLPDLEAVLQEKIAQDTQLEMEAEAAAAAAGTSGLADSVTPAIATPDVQSAVPSPPPGDALLSVPTLAVTAAPGDRGAAGPASTSTPDIPEADDAASGITPITGRGAGGTGTSSSKKSTWKTRYRFQGIRDPKEFIDALRDHKNMEADDLFACLARINESLVAWQDEYRFLRGITDDEENAVRRRQQDATFENRTQMALRRGNVDTDIIERDFVVKGIRAPQEANLADPIKRHTRAQDKLMSQIYLFEYDPRDSMTGRQDPVAQREGLQNTRLRNRPKLTQKAADAAEAEDLANGGGSGAGGTGAAGTGAGGIIGRRTRMRGRRALEDESQDGSRAGTPAAAPPPPPTTAPPTVTRGRRGRPSAASIAAAKEAAAAAAAAAAATAAGEERVSNKDHDISFQDTPTPIKRRRGRQPRSQLSESVVADDMAQEAATPTSSPYRRGSNNTLAPPSREKATASTPTQIGPGRKRRRGRRPNSMLVQSQENIDTASGASTTGSGKRPRITVVNANNKRENAHLAEIGPGSFYSNGSYEDDEAADRDDNARPSSSSSNGTAGTADSNYSLRPNRRRRNFAGRGHEEEAEEHVDAKDADTAPPPKKRRRRRTQAEMAADAAAAAAATATPANSKPVYADRDRSRNGSLSIGAPPPGNTAPYDAAYPPQNQPQQYHHQHQYAPPPPYTTSVNHYQPPPPQQHQPPPYGTPTPPGAAGGPRPALAPAPTGGPHPPAAGRQRTTFKIKNYTPAPVAPSAGVHAFTQMLPNSGGGQRGSGSAPPSAGNSPNLGAGPPRDHHHHHHHHRHHHHQQSPQQPVSSGGHSQHGSPAQTPVASAAGGANLAALEDDKDYRQMTKSEKMSHSMKTRWANGSMQAAVAKRKATLAAKKAAAQAQAANTQQHHHHHHHHHQQPHHQQNHHQAAVSAQMTASTPQHVGMSPHHSAQLHSAGAPLHGGGGGMDYPMHGMHPMGGGPRHPDEAPLYAGGGRQEA